MGPGPLRGTRSCGASSTVFGQPAPTVCGALPVPGCREAGGGRAGARQGETRGAGPRCRLCHGRAGRPWARVSLSLSFQHSALGDMGTYTPQSVCSRKPSMRGHTFNTVGNYLTSKFHCILAFHLSIAKWIRYSSVFLFWQFSMWVTLCIWSNVGGGGSIFIYTLGLISVIDFCCYLDKREENFLHWHLIRT